MSLDSTSSCVAVVLCPVAREKDPRHDWWAASLAHLPVTTQVWSQHRAPFAEIRGMKRSRRLETTLRAWEARGSDPTVYLDLAFAARSGFRVRRSLSSWLKDTEDTSAAQLVSLLLHEATSRQNTLLSRGLARNFLGFLDALFALGQNLRPRLVVANDLVTAFAAVITWAEMGTVCVYDAQEFFVEQFLIDQLDVTFTPREIEIWEAVEEFAVQRADYNVTISPGGATFLKEKYSSDFFVIPNFVPLELKPEAGLRNEKVVPMDYVFMGQASPRRGLEQLLQNWGPATSEERLHLYIPDSAHKSRLQEMHAKLKPAARSRIFFRSPVNEDRMLDTLKVYDIGIIPYDYAFPYNHASPNKLGQYLAAGLPILANGQPFVSEVINCFDIGWTFDWEDPASLGVAIARIRGARLPEVREKVARSFISSCNWNSATEDLMNILITHLSTHQELTEIHYKDSRGQATNIVAQRQKRNWLNDWIRELVWDFGFLSSTLVGPILIRGREAFRRFAARNGL